MRVLLTGGGTAGHINPALAIAETVKRNDPGAEILFVGIENGKEAELVPREGYPIRYVESMGIRRSLSLSNLKAVYLAIHSPHSKKTLSVLREFRPDIVIGTGGYACWPIMAAAARMGIPTAVHESNAIPGLAVKQLQGRVDRIWLNFERTAERLHAKEKAVRVGNPLRGGFGAISKEDARKKLGISPDRKLILSFGGSGGAEGVNLAVVRLMKEYCSLHPEILHVHAAGKRDYHATLENFAASGLDQNAKNCVVVEYIYDMPLRMAAADLVISRAGAMTLSELALMGKACVLIPSPYVAENHQYCNARELSDVGAAVLVEEQDLTSGALTTAVKNLFSDAGSLRSMEEKIPAFADSAANERIWNEIKELLEKKKAKEH